MGQNPSEIREEIEQTRGQMGETIEAIGYKSDVKARAKDSVSEKVDSVRSKITGVSGRASEVTPSSEDVRQGAQQAAGIARENPIGLAVAGAAAGFLLGLVLPSTPVEDEKIGPAATQVKEQAKQTGEEALERGKDVAQSAVQSAMETAQEGVQEQTEELRQSTQERATTSVQQDAV